LQVKGLGFAPITYAKANPLTCLGQPEFAEVLIYERPSDFYRMASSFPIKTLFQRAPQRQSDFEHVTAVRFMTNREVTPILKKILQFL
jgi:hypothetical protein